MCYYDNTDGYNELGYDRDGYDIEGFNVQGYDRGGYNRRGYDVEGFDREGFSSSGYNRDGIDRDGYDMDGFKDGYDREGYDHQGFGSDGFNRDGIDREGYNRAGYDADGYDRNGWDVYGFNRVGRDQFGFDVQGWNESGINILGYDKSGFNSAGLSLEGYSKEQFDADGYNLLTGFNLKGYDRDGFNINDIDAFGYDRDGYNSISGLNHAGYDRDGYDRNGFDKEGYNRNGYDKDGYDRDGYNYSGYNRNGYNKEGYNFSGYDKRGYDIYGYNKAGEFDPERASQEDVSFSADTSKSTDRKLEQQYLSKCVKEVQRIKDKEFAERKRTQYPPKTLYWYSDCELQKKEVIQPDTSQLEGILNRKYFDQLSQPYMSRVSYGETPELYLGKKEVYGWVVDWADPRAKYYYQYQIYIGNEETQLSLVRDFYISLGRLHGYKDLYNNEIVFTTSDQAKIHASKIADERLRQIIEANRESKQIHDIIVSIQQNQYNIIAENKDENLVVNGCAGSGKSMILMHRIRFIKYNNDVNLTDFIVISPTKALSQESRQLSQILQVSDIQQYSTAEFYAKCIETYFQRSGFMHESLSVSEDAIFDATLYKEKNLGSLLHELRLLSASKHKEKDVYIADERHKVENLIAQKCSNLNIKPDDFAATVSTYQKVKNDVTQYSLEALSQFREDIEQKLNQMGKTQTVLDFFTALIDLNILSEKSGNSAYSKDAMNRLLPLTHRVIYQLDMDGWLNAVNNEKDKLTTIKSCVLSMQLYLGNPLGMAEFRVLVNELTNISAATIQSYCQHIEDELSELDMLSNKADALDAIVSKGLINKDASKKVPDGAFDSLSDFYVRYAATLEEENLDIFDFFDSCIVLQNRLDALETDEKAKNGNSYLFYKILYVLNVAEDSRVITVNQAFAMLYLLNARLSSVLDNSEKYLYIDEFQDMAPAELTLLMQVFPNAHFALFGDPNQCINEKGISNIRSLPESNWHEYKITENYRNAHEITTYVNRRMGMSMRPVGLKGIQRTVAELPQLTISKDDRIAVIVKNDGEEFDKIVATYGQDIVNVYSITHEMKRGVYNIVPIQFAKGLEFEKVIVFNNAMTPNEFYVACTRAISELYVIDSLLSEESILDNTRKSIVSDELQNEAVDSNPIPRALRDVAISVDISGELNGKFYLLPYVGGLKQYTKKKLTNMFVPVKLNAKERLLLVSVDKECNLIYLQWATFSKYKDCFEASSRFLLTK